MFAYCCKFCEKQSVGSQVERGAHRKGMTTFFLNEEKYAEDFQTAAITGY
jgi:hypothetical protein